MPPLRIFVGASPFRKFLTAVFNVFRVLYFFWHFLAFSGIFRHKNFNTIRHFSAFFNIFRHFFGIFWHFLAFFGTFLALLPKICHFVGNYSDFWSILFLAFFGIFWHFLAFFGTFWHNSALFGAIRHFSHQFGIFLINSAFFSSIRHFSARRFLYRFQHFSKLKFNRRRHYAAQES